MTGGIHFPSQILAYGGNGTGRYAFLGGTEVQPDRDNSPDSAMKYFHIRFPARTVSEVVVVVFARGTFLFLGEISARGADGGEVINPYLESLAGIELDAIARRRKDIAALPGPHPTGPDMARRWALPLTTASPNASETSPRCTIERIEPWPDSSASAEPLPADAPLIASEGSRDFAAFRLANKTQLPAEVRLAIGKRHQAVARIHALAYAQALDYSWVPDVVVPFGRDSALPSRSQAELLIEVGHGLPGDDNLELSVSCGETRQSFRIPMTTVPSGPAPPLHGNLWAYLHEPQHTTVSRALACEPDFLRRHGVDTGLVHPDALMDDNGPRPTDLLRRYFRAYRDMPRILLFMAANQRNWHYRKLNDHDAAENLSRWWEWIRTTAASEGASGELILYPIDEPRKSDAALLQRTSTLARAAAIEAKIYATVDDPAIGIEFLDLIQMLRQGSSLGARKKTAQIESYDTRPDGRLLSPHSYYRLQGWRAFQRNLAGVGIWSAWDSSGNNDPGTGWNPFTGHRERDFGLIYSAPDGCGWPSRRLLAWKRGKDEALMLRTCLSKAHDPRTAVAVTSALADSRPATARAALQQVASDCTP